LNTTVEREVAASPLMQFPNLPHPEVRARRASLEGRTCPMPVSRLLATLGFFP
jgi:hypothetical protein